MQSVVARLAAVGRRVTPASAGELAGLALFDAGVWMVFEPLAVMLAGAGIVLYFQGRKDAD